MHASVYLPLVIAGLFGLIAPRLALRLPLGFTLVGQAQPLDCPPQWRCPSSRGRTRTPPPPATVEAWLWR